MSEIIKLTIPKNSKYVSVIRLTTSSISNILNFNIDDIEDIKIILSEICVFFINNIKENDMPLHIEFEICKDKLKVEVIDTNNESLIKKTSNELSILIIQSLADEYEINYIENKISFSKNI